MGIFRIKIVFMGTPDFAVESLRVMIENNLNVVAVITAPDKPAGRGRKITQSPVKTFAEKHELKVLQPTNLKSEEFIEELKAISADLFVVVAFRMLPEVIWQLPPLGTINLHASLLPQYRGAAPINHAIINGEKTTGVTTFFIEKEIDTGGIIQQEEVEITATETAESLHEKLMFPGSKILLSTVLAIAAHKAQPIDQKKLTTRWEELKPAPKIFKENCEIKWGADVQTIYNFIRGLSPYPAAWTMAIDGKGEPTQLKVFAAKMIHEIPTLEPGTFTSDGRTFIRVAAKNGFLELHSIQVPGKKRMEVSEFLKGNRLG